MQRSFKHRFQIRIQKVNPAKILLGLLHSSINVLASECPITRAAATSSNSKEYFQSLRSWQLDLGVETTILQDGNGYSGSDHKCMYYHLLYLSSKCWIIRPSHNQLHQPCLMLFHDQALPIVHMHRPQLFRSWCC